MEATTKNKVSAIRQFMWDNGMADPKTNITQITYLLFLKMLDDEQIKKEKNANAFHTVVKDPTFPNKVYKIKKDEDGNVVDNITYEDLRWHNFKNYETERMFNIVKDYAFPFLKSLGEKEDTVYKNLMEDAKLTIPSAKVLDGVIKRLDDEELSLDHKEVIGDAYELFLSDINASGTMGQFRSPRHIIDMMVKLMEPKLGEVICDPSMGSAGFLLSSVSYMKEKYKNELLKKENLDFLNNRTFHGYDIDPDMVRIGSMNMYLHGIKNPSIYLKNSLTDENTDSYQYDLVLANPPFSGSLDANDISPKLKSICSSKSTELLFIALFLRSLKIGGRCASIVPVGVVNNTNEKAYTVLRKEIVENQRLRAIIYLPSGVFKPYSGVQTAIIIFDKTDNGGTDKVWLYNMENDGYSLDDKRNKIAQNDIPDILTRYFDNAGESERTAYDKSFFVTKEEIVANDYVLSLNKYQKKHIEKKEYRSTAEIIKSLRESETEYLKLLDEIEGK